LDSTPWEVFYRHHSISRAYRQSGLARRLSIVIYRDQLEPIALHGKLVAVRVVGGDERGLPRKKAVSD
jgi:hypothetical protein